MLQTLAACATVVGLVLVFTSDVASLTLLGGALLAVAAALTLRHPEWMEMDQ